MDALHTLLHSVEETHRTLLGRLDVASGMVTTPGQPRKGFEHTDTFLAATCRHLNAVEQMLVPAVRKHLPDGRQLTHDYVHTSRRLELALATVKAREYGSVYAIRLPWPELWREVRDQLEAQYRLERSMAVRLSEVLPGPDLMTLTDRLYRSELTSPTRAHPYIPHLGMGGKVARRVMRTVDSFWDTAEGRMVPEPARPPHKRPGLLTQYLLADPRFDEDEP